MEELDLISKSDRETINFYLSRLSGGGKAKFDEEMGRPFSGQLTGCRAHQGVSPIEWPAVDMDCFAAFQLAIICMNDPGVPKSNTPSPPPSTSRTPATSATGNVLFPASAGGPVMAELDGYIAIANAGDPNGAVELFRKKCLYLARETADKAIATTTNAGFRRLFETLKRYAAGGRCQGADYRDLIQILYGLAEVLDYLGIQ
jgi:hypothetical protein